MLSHYHLPFSVLFSLLLCGQLHQSAARSLLSRKQSMTSNFTAGVSGGKTNVLGKPLQACSKDGTAMTGFTRTGQCVDEGNDDEGSHHICIIMKSDFCTVTGQPDWCSEKMPCMGQSGECSIGNWCVCQWAFASYLAAAGGCDKATVDVVCDSTNQAALKAYTKSTDPTHKAALQCIQSKCDMQGGGAIHSLYAASSSDSKVRRRRRRRAQRRRRSRRRRRTSVVSPPRTAPENPAPPGTPEFPRRRKSEESRRRRRRRRNKYKSSGFQAFFYSPIGKDNAVARFEDSANAKNGSFFLKRIGDGPTAKTKFRARVSGGACGNGTVLEFQLDNKGLDYFRNGKQERSPWSFLKNVEWLRNPPQMALPTLLYTGQNAQIIDPGFFFAKSSPADTFASVGTNPDFERCLGKKLIGGEKLVIGHAKMSEDASSISGVDNINELLE